MTHWEYLRNWAILMGGMGLIGGGLMMIHPGLFSIALGVFIFLVEEPAGKLMDNEKRKGK